MNQIYIDYNAENEDSCTRLKLFHSDLVKKQEGSPRISALSKSR